MRLGWSVLCKDFEEHNDGMLTLTNVFAEAKVSITPPTLLIELDPPIILISYWFTESELDMHRYPAILRVLAPEDDQILAEWRFSIDFVLKNSRLMVFYFRELTFSGAGFYEFHVEVLQYGEWNIMSQNSLYLDNKL